MTCSETYHVAQGVAGLPTMAPIGRDFPVESTGIFCNRPIGPKPDAVSPDSEAPLESG